MKFLRRPRQPQILALVGAPQGELVDMDDIGGQKKTYSILSKTFHEIMQV